MPLFDARAAAEATADDYPPFEFVGLDGETYQLPNLLTLTERQIARINRGEQAQLIAEIAPEAWSAIEEMPVHVSRQLGEAWAAEGGEAGKSPGRSRRTSSGAKPSRRT